MTDKSQSAKPLIQPARTRNVIRMTWLLIKAMGWGLLIALVINAVQWHEHGYQRVISTLTQRDQAQIQALGLRSAWAARLAQWVSQDTDAQASWFAQQSQEVLHDVPLLERLWHTAKHPSDGWRQGLVHGLHLLWGTVVLIALKGVSLMVSVWVWVFAGLLGAMDGLLARYIRTQEGGRESTFIFHRVADKVIGVPVMLLLVYLAVPLFVNPEWVVMAMSVMVFVFFYLLSANLKKFL